LKEKGEYEIKKRRKKKRRVMEEQKKKKKVEGGGRVKEGTVKKEKERGK